MNVYILPAIQFMSTSTTLEETGPSNKSSVAPAPDSAMPGAPSSKGRSSGPSLTMRRGQEEKESCGIQRIMQDGPFHRIADAPGALHVSAVHGSWVPCVGQTSLAITSGMVGPSLFNANEILEMFSVFASVFSLGLSTGLSLRYQSHDP